MARAIAISTAIGAAVAACFTTPSRPPGGGLRDDAGNLVKDASKADDADPDSMFVNIDAPDGACNVEEFTGSGSGSCGSWGSFSSSGSGYVSQGNGVLTLGMFGSGAGHVQCASPIGQIQRVVIDLASVAATDSGKESTFVGLSTTDQVKRWGLTLSNDGNTGSAGLTTECPDGVTSSPEVWDGNEMRFVQIEKWMTSSVRISTSPDNITYKEVLVCGTAAEVYQGTSAVQLRLSKGATTTSSQTASFERLEICR